MRFSITDTHNAHGLVFTLNLTGERGSFNDQKSLEQLCELLRPLIEGKMSGHSALYSEKIMLSENEISLVFAEGVKHLARVDYRWNHKREDQKYVVLIIESDSDIEQLAETAKHFLCYLCKQDAWGVHRDTMEVFDKTTQCLKLVSVHRECRKIREKQIADLPFAGV